ncbi:hypothetical protein CROQUDRAFT_45844 [Cronartium quercuum f. sp. fusiforme G11]|uniref:Uncharacterized protein n=1 Tax=Cronartium quercuum f. sp. fusiforme G11 TaxID=708437 RepID=A0A9P6NKV6_9BASI|nr:hypothetical protein CROQUDRAFT_45844 [Cronartium quercuum f. sp. fusiforme G11]
MPPKRKAGSEAPASKSKSTETKTNSKAEEGSSKKAKPAFTKIVPDLTKEEFLEANHEIEIALGTNGELGKFKLQPTEFSTGSWGWRLNEKVKVTVNVDGVDKELQVQAGINMTVSGSKPTGKRGRPRKVTADDNDDE